MSIEFKEPRREDAPLLIGLAGGTGSGKTYTALRLARGLAGGMPFAVIDTENGRALHYTDFFPEMRHGRLDAPFSPSAYTEAVKAADAAGFPVIVVDSTSHIWEGEGGVLEMQVAEHARLGNREATKMLSWAAPKTAHKAFVRSLLQVKAHVILCMRAEDKIEMVKENGNTVVRPKQGLKGSGLDGWFPICEKRLPFELTLSFLLTSEQPGVPRPIKLQEQHKAFFPLDKQVGEETGKRLAEWAAGGSGSVGGVVSSSDAIEARDEASRVEAASPAEGNSGQEPESELGASVAKQDASTVPSGSAAPAISTGEQPSSADLLSDAQAKKLDVLVGQLRDAGHITNEQVWKACGREPVPDLDGSVHWSPLRRTLTKAEASALIERLTTFQQKVTEAAA